MSSSHLRAHHAEYSDLERVRKRYLLNPRVQEYLKRPYERIWHPMILTGGSSLDGSRYYLDPQLQRPVQTNVGPRRLDSFVLIHERVEKALRVALGLSYDVAHAVATRIEQATVEAAGISWEVYKHIMSRIVRADEREQPDFPPGFDMTPVNEWRRERSAARTASP